MLKYNRSLTIIVVIILIISAVFISYFYFFHDSQRNVPVFNEDYKFVTIEGEEHIETSDGWTFDINPRQNYTLEGIVLGHLYYKTNDRPYRPINYFSPIDIWVGIDDISEDPSKYEYEINSFHDRDITWYVQDHYDYFQSHTGLNHLIPHNEEVHKKLMNLEDKDRFRLEGQIVEPYGTRGDEYYNWPSDNDIGDYDCEVILVDSFEIL